MTQKFSAKNSFTLGLAISVAVLILAVLAPMRTEAYASDAFRCLDGGYRMASGLRIHRDFYTPLGAPYLGAVGIGVALVGPHLSAFKVALLVWAIPLLAYAVLILPPRLGPKFSGLAMVALATLLAGPACLGDPEAKSWSSAFVTTYGMQYNRFLAASFGLVGIAMLIPGPDPKRRTWEAFGAGAITAAMLLTKLNYGLAVLPFFVVALLRRDRIVVGRAGFLGVVSFLLLMAVSGVSAPGYLAELRQLSASQEQTPLQMLGSSVSKVAVSKWSAIAVLAAIGLALVGSLRFRVPVAATRALAAAAVALFGALLMGPNYQRGENWAFPLAALVACTGWTIPDRYGEIVRKLLAAVPIGGYAAMSAAALAFPYWTAGRDVSSPEADKNRVTRGTVIVPGSAAEKHTRIMNISSGVVRSLEIPLDKRIRFLAGAQISLFIGSRPEGGTLWFHEGHTITAETARPFDLEFGDTDVVLFRTEPSKRLSFGERMYADAAIRRFSYPLGPEDGFSGRARFEINRKGQSSGAHSQSEISEPSKKSTIAWEGYRIDAARVLVYGVFGDAVLP